MIILLSDNPGSIYREDALYYKFEASTNLAMNSFDYLKKERLNDAKAAYVTFKKYFPESKYVKDANKTLEKVEKELEIYSK